MAVGGEDLKHLRVDAPPAAAEVMDEQRGNRAEQEIGGLEVRALLQRHNLALLPMSALRNR